MSGSSTAKGGDDQRAMGDGLVFEGGKRVAVASLVVGVVGLGAVAVGAVFDGRQAAFSYLMAFIFWHSIAFGGLIHLMIQHAINASWGVVVRRLAEGVAGTMPVLALLFLPLLAGLELLYPWVRPGVEGGGVVAERALERGAYLNVPFFVVRAAVYFAIWIVVGWLLERWTLRQVGEGEGGGTAGGGGGGGVGAPVVGKAVPGEESHRRRGVKLARRQRALSAVGLPVVAFVVTFAATDWVMSLDPEWYSTIFGVYYFSGSAVAIVALLVLLSHGMQRRGYLRGEVTLSHYHALGKLLLVFVVFWAYIAFMQFLVIWIADIPREVEWYLIRSRGSWAVVATLLVVGHFLLPFFALLSWRLKRIPVLLAGVCGWVLALHLVDIYWLILPALHPAGFHPNWLDLAALAGVGGMTVAYGVWQFRGRIVAPIADPRYEESLEFYTT